jgi:hypothetical protein
VGQALDELASRGTVVDTVSELNDVNNSEVNVTTGNWTEVGILVWDHDRHSLRDSGTLVAWVSTGNNGSISLRVVNLATASVLGSVTQPAATSGPVNVDLILPTADADLAVQIKKDGSGPQTNGDLRGCQVEWRR